MKINLFIRQLINYFAPNTALKIIGIVLLILPSAFLVYYLVFLPVSGFPERILGNEPESPLPSITKADSLNPELDDLLEHWQELNRKYHSVNSLLALAAQDSIYLWLNLADSSFNLLIKGVTIRSAKLLDFETAKGIELLKSKGQFALWAGKPFTLENEWASIEKSPLKVKEAPKDTIEAMENMVEPAPAPIQDVHVSLKFNRELILHISQFQRTMWRNYTKRVAYEWDWLNVAVGETIDLLKSEKEVPPPMWINIEIDRSDALAFYRAIPKKAGLVITY